MFSTTVACGVSTVWAEDAFNLWAESSGTVDTVDLAQKQKNTFMSSSKDNCYTSLSNSGLHTVNVILTFFK